MRWFYFKSGANPYGIYADRLDLFFAMVMNYNLSFIDGTRLYCTCQFPYPIRGYYERQERLRSFAKDWQKAFQDLVSMSWEEVLWYSNFFEVYGRKYGLLREFKENGII